MASFSLDMSQIDLDMSLFELDMSPFVLVTEKVCEKVLNRIPYI